MAQIVKNICCRRNTPIAKHLQMTHIVAGFIQFYEMSIYGPNISGTIDGVDVRNSRKRQLGANTEGLQN